MERDFHTQAVEAASKREPRRIRTLATLAGVFGIGVAAALFTSQGNQIEHAEGSSVLDNHNVTLFEGEAASGAVDCASDPEGITHGPHVGAVEYLPANHQSVKIWVRTCQPGEDVVAEVKSASDDWGTAQLITSEHELTDAEKDNTAVVRVSDLAPDTQYEYRLKVNDNLPVEPNSGQFETMPPRDAPSQFSFILSTDIHLPQFPPVLTELNNLRSHDPRFLVMNGDNIVIETLTAYNPQFKSEYETLYRRAWLMDGVPQLFANLSTLMTWDDHEILNNWSGGTNPPYPSARAAYEEYINSINPDNLTKDGVYYTFDAGQVGFFVLDTRTFRSPNMDPDGPDKTMLGAVQKSALESWLLTSKARFKFIISSVMWNEFSGHIIVGESWPAFKTERNEIFNFIKDNKIGGVILTSGDEHWTGVFKMTPWGIYEVAGGPLTWFQRKTASVDPQILYKQNTARVFALYKVDTQNCPASLNLQIFDATNNVPIYSLPLTEKDLGGDADGDGLLPCEEQQYGTDPNRADTDGDGCIDGRETGNDQRLGGRRNPTYSWDYFDTPNQRNERDGKIHINDISNIITRYRANDNNRLAPVNRYTDFRSVPPSTGYHPAFDRGPRVGMNLWDLGAPNGTIDISDISSVIQQYRNDCK